MTNDELKARCMEILKATNYDLEVEFTCNRCGQTATRAHWVAGHLLMHLRAGGIRTPRAEQGYNGRKLTLVRIKAEPGQCYFNSFAFMVANAQFAESHKLRYVQGVVTSTEDGARIGHCWVELTDPATGEEFVLEPVPHGLIPKAEYYARGKADHLHRYELEHMLRVYADCKFWGPWTDDVRAGLHTGEAPAPEKDQELVKMARALGLPAIEVD